MLDVTIRSSGVTHLWMALIIVGSHRDYKHKLLTQEEHFFVEQSPPVPPSQGSWYGFSLLCKDLDILVSRFAGFCSNLGDGRLKRYCRKFVLGQNLEIISKMPKINNKYLVNSMASNTDRAFIYFRGPILSISQIFSFVNEWWKRYEDIYSKCNIIIVMNKQCYRNT